MSNSKKTLKVIFWAYRDWGKAVYSTIARHPRVSESLFCETREAVLACDLDEYDLLLTCGLSEELGSEITEWIRAIGVHCAELDRYSYGTPIQLQVIDGIRFSKHRIFSFIAPEKNSHRAHTHDRLYANETVLDLTGNMADIMEQLTATSKVLFNQFLDEYPDNHWRQWPEETITRQKRNPQDSALSVQQLADMDTEQMYNFFRCLESPYPNGYIEDEKGRLYIERVMYKRK